ncbi:hypothetical protein GCM10010532_079810 [Dactylosporangium siamense]|uniref:Uncharacterized protein n=1 Tax=Dactylosporangium siamense TaxID=685454 RepID=A0A919PRL7_9ACTN|nr:hypothetical protein Dsi01nite_069250 [Dactylosporangium siamense]
MLSLPDVIGVGIGRDDAGAEVIDVYVQRAVPRRDLDLGATIPDALEGVPVRVVPIGEVTAQGN